jgi:O-acetyl-ADP-ribose deacetylase (regulator of RNase III)
MVINVGKGNLLELGENYYYVHCLSEDLKMGKGISLELKNKFNLGEKFRKIRTVKIGDAILTDNVFNLIIRKKVWDIPNYDTLKTVLENMKTTCLNNNIKRIALCKFTQDVEGLDWSKSKHIIETIFENTDIEIQVRY